MTISDEKYAEIQQALAEKELERLRAENAELRKQFSNVADYCRDMACRCPIPVVEWLVSVAKQIEGLLAKPGAGT
jgi:hypothetical protein